MCLQGVAIIIRVAHDLLVWGKESAIFVATSIKDGCVRHAA